jgi:hypothetical protein
MQVMIRRYRMNKGSVDDLMHKIDTDFVDDLQTSLEMVAYQAVHAGDQEVWTITTFRDGEALERALGPAERVRTALAEFEVEQILASAGEVMVMRTSAAAQATIHH